MFTLGFSRPAQQRGNVIVFIAAASGLAVLALLIGYLPLLYAAFNRREIARRHLRGAGGRAALGS